MDIIVLHSLTHSFIQQMVLLSTDSAKLLLF